jgi:hypothetical protein
MMPIKCSGMICSIISGFAKAIPDTIWVEHHYRSRTTNSQAIGFIPNNANGRLSWGWSSFNSWIRRFFCSIPNIPD